MRVDPEVMRNALAVVGEPRGVSYWTGTRTRGSLRVGGPGTLWRMIALGLVLLVIGIAVVYLVAEPLAQRLGRLVAVIGVVLLIVGVVLLVADGGGVHVGH
jgi:hypothetical protein